LKSIIEQFVINFFIYRLYGSFAAIEFFGTCHLIVRWKTGEGEKSPVPIERFFVSYRKIYLF